MLSYIKNYLPTYLFGTMVSLETLAVYSIFKKITDFLHKGYAGFIQSLYPKLFQMMHSKSKAIDKLFWIGLGLRLMVFIALYFGYDVILSLYDIQESNLDSLIFIVLISAFFVMYFATFSNLIVMNSKQTGVILWASITRTVLSTALIFVLYQLFNMVGLILSIFLSSLIGLTYMMSHANKMHKLKYFLHTYFLVVSVLISFILIKIGF